MIHWFRRLRYRLSSLRWRLRRRDPLTRLHVRRVFMRNLARQQNRGRFSLIMLNLDGMKMANDALGHGEIDRTLARIGGLVNRAAGEGAATGRISGDGFAILLPGKSLGDAMVVAEDLRKEIEQATSDVAARVREVHNVPSILTASFGISDSHEADSSDDLMRLVDFRTYLAKQAGKNRFCSQSAAPPPPRDIRCLVSVRSPTGRQR
jgi:diguanylate cyclase (GGDEF)-like protein